MTRESKLLIVAWLLLAGVARTLVSVVMNHLEYLLPLLFVCWTGGIVSEILIRNYLHWRKT